MKLKLALGTNDIINRPTAAHHFLAFTKGNVIEVNKPKRANEVSQVAVPFATLHSDNGTERRKSE